MAHPESAPAPSSISYEEDKLREECGVFALAGKNPGAIWMAYDAAITMKNRGDQMTGVGTFVDGVPMGVVGDGPANVAFNNGKNIAGLGDTNIAIAHMLYSTQENKQPQPIQLGESGLIVTNGNITNADELLGRYGISAPEDMSDSGKVARLLTTMINKLGSTEAAIEDVVPKLRGAFSTLIIEKDRIIAFRDRVGYRPLHKGRLSDGSGWAIASETPVFDMIDAELEGTIEPGTYEIINSDGTQKVHRWGRTLHPKGKAIVCGMGLAYFERADGQVEEIDVAAGRERTGEFLAQDYPVEADMVAPYPDSARQLATGISNTLGIVVRDAFLKNDALGKTYIQPVGKIKKAVKLKLNPIRSAVGGRRLIAGEDSIVRGNTTRNTIALLKKYGALEIHMRISYPQIKYGCDFGMNMKPEDGLLAIGRTKEEMADKIGADSLEFLTPERYAQAYGRELGELCMGCATGIYPETKLDQIRAEEALAAQSKASKQQKSEDEPAKELVLAQV